MSTLAVITNRSSTRNAKDGDWITPLVAADGDVLHFPVDDIQQLPSIIAQCAEADVDTIAINGGDGTIGLVFGALLNHRPYTRLPNLALLAGGKTNMTASRWGLSGEKPEALRRLIAERRKGPLAPHIREHAVLGLQQGPGEAPLYGTFFGAAELVEGILFCRRHVYPLNLPDPVSHAVATSWLLWRSILGGGDEQRRIDIAEMRGPLESGNFFLVAATVLDELLLGIKPEPSTDAGTHGFYYMSLRNRPGAILRTAANMIRRRLRPSVGITVRHTNCVTLNFTGPYTLDGELHEARADKPIILNATQRLPFVQFR